MSVWVRHQARRRFAGRRILFVCAAAVTLVLAIFLAGSAAVAAEVPGESHSHHDHQAATARSEPSSFQGNWDFLSNYGNYMPRVHCLSTAEGKPDWPWIIGLIVLTAGVVISYLRIFVFWIKTYKSEAPADRNKKLLDLAYIFLWCSICGYALSILIFFWPAYRLLAMCLAVLNFFSWRFMTNVDDFKLALSAKRLQRMLMESVERRNSELQSIVVARTAELAKVSKVADATSNCVMITDVAFGIDWVNDGFTRVTGYTLDEVRGKQPASFMYGPETDTTVVNAMERQLAQVKPFRTELIKYDRNGRAYWVNIDIQPLFDEQGKHSGFMSMELDVTREKQAQQKAESHRLLLSALLDSAPDMICVRNITGKFIEANEVYCGFFGLSKTSLMGTGLEDHFDSNISQQMREGDVSVLVQGVVSKSEDWYTSAEGHKVLFETIKTPVLGQGGDRIGVLCISRDVTVRQQAQDAQEHAREAAERANCAKSAFVANMSHEIRTPLNGVIGTLQLLEMTTLDSRQERYVQMARGSADVLLAQINDVLDFSKIEAGQMQLAAVDFNIATLAEETVTFFAQRAREKHIELIYRMDPRIESWVNGDSERVRQILINLIGNAIKFTESGEIEVRIDCADSETADGRGELTFSVRDTGPGICPTDQEKLFRSFSQLEDRKARQHGGTGLGLAICAQLCELMGGRIRVESREGAGSTFIFSLQFQGPQDQKRTRSIPTRILSDLSVMIVEPNDTLRGITVEMFRQWGCRVHESGTMEDAWSQLEDRAGAGQPVQLILTEVALNQDDGLELVRRVRGHAAMSYTYVIFYTSVEPEDIADLRALAVEGIIAKPAGASMIFGSVVDTVMGSKEALMSTPMSEQIGQPIDSDTASLRILVAEDNAVNRMVATEFLRWVGIEPEVVVDGELAVEIAIRERFDLILMDCQMPRCDGFEATVRIRDAEKQGQIDYHPVIIALTASAMSGDRERCLAAGMDDYICKPIDKNQLIDIVLRYTRREEAAASGAEGLPSMPVASDDEAMPLNVEEMGRNLGNEKMLMSLVLDGFFDSCVPDCMELVAAAERDDRQRIQFLAHKMKGCAAQAAATRVVVVARNLEDHGLEMAVEEMRSQVEELQREVDRCVEARPAIAEAIEKFSE